MLSSLTDLSALPDDLVRQLENTITDYERRQHKLRSWREVLDHGTDEEIMEKAREECDEGAPISFARNYPKQGYLTVADRTREIVPLNMQDHPRRPVIMKGAVKVCYIRYSLSEGRSAPNGWLIRVHERAVRMSKKTLIEWQEIVDFSSEVAARLAERHYGITSHFWDYIRPRSYEVHTGNNLVLMSGRWVSLPYEQYRNVQMFQKVIRKTQKLEDRLELLRAARKERADGRNA
jgi:hypothetical protein